MCPLCFKKDNNNKKKQNTVNNLAQIEGDKKLLSLQDKAFSKLKKENDMDELREGKSTMTQLLMLMADINYIEI